MTLKMSKVITPIICIIAFLNISNSIDINCQFSSGSSYTSMGSIYQCESKSPNILTLESAQINKITGTHQSAKSNDDVFGFHADYQVISYFPQGLDKSFKNLKLIAIWRSQLKEIHQSDLKPFTKLICLYLHQNAIEVLEEGLLDFNPDLEKIGFSETKIFHIDAKIFDPLTKIDTLWASDTPCIKNSFSVFNIKDGIKLIKSQCVSSEFTSLDEKIKTLENESKSLALDAFNEKLIAFEATFKNSKLSQFRPLNYKFQNLKNIKIGNTVALVSHEDLKACSNNSGSVISSMFVETVTNCCKANQDLELDVKLGNLSIHLKDKVSEAVTKISGSIIDLKSSQDKIQGSLNNFENTFNSIKKFQNEFEASRDIFNAFQSEIKTSIKDLKTSQDLVAASQNELKAKSNEREISHDRMKGSISDIEGTLSDVKISQNEVLSSLIRLKTLQNEMKISLNAIRSNQADKTEEQFPIFNEKLENLEAHFVNFETKAMEKIEIEMANTRHKISINFDEKIRGIEKRLMKKFEETLEEKLEKILDKKLGQVIDARLGN